MKEPESQTTFRQVDLAVMGKILLSPAGKIANT
jgi:hypothetical protein